jgi:hypothetical protein
MGLCRVVTLRVADDDSKEELQVLQEELEGLDRRSTRK